MDTEHGEVQEIEDEYKEPTIDQVGNITFVGINHYTHLSKEHRPSSKVLDVVHDAEHLLIEGANIPTPGKIRNYELETAEDFQERGKASDIHMLEEGTDHAALAEKYGLDQKTFLLFNYYRITHGAFDAFLKDNDISNLSEIKDDYISGLVELGVPGSSQFTAEELQKLAQHVIETDMRLLQNGALETRDYMASAAFQLNNEFVSPIRDYEVLFPRIQEYDRTLQGKKAVIIGKNHVPALVDALEKGQMDAPPNWQQFMDGLEVEDKKAFELFDKVIVHGKKEKHWQRWPVKSSGEGGTQEVTE